MRPPSFDKETYKEPIHPIHRFPKHKSVINSRQTAATPVGDRTIMSWITGSVGRSTIISHYVWLKYAYEVEYNKRRRWAEQVRQLKKRVKELEEVESKIEQKLRNKLVFGELPKNISKDIDKLMMDAYIKGKVKI
tara:strand:+ start:302 stop:706 length:405 start_codon:yes stop_codon:yes gene_type:complete